MHKGLIFFPPSGHKEKLGEGERIVLPAQIRILWVIYWNTENKISQFRPLHFTFRLFSSETNGDSFQRMISELAEQI